MPETATATEMASVMPGSSRRGPVGLPEPPFFVETMSNRPGGRRDSIVREALTRPGVSDQLS
jgi:hypothetical protein